MLSDASRRLYDSAKPSEQGEGEAETHGELWVKTADTRKMTLAEYKKFLSAQHVRGEQN